MEHVDMTDEASITFDVVRNARLFEEICGQIKTRLSEGKIRPGDKLPPERDLAEQFGVSRSAVREALRALEVSGLVELRKGAKGGAFLLEETAPLIQSMEDMIDLGRVSLRDFTEARILLTEVVVRLACERGKKKDFDAIENDIEKTEVALAQADRSAELSHITNFYDLLAAATGNQMLRYLTHAIARLLTRLINAKRPSQIRDLGARRRAILKCLRSRDCERAARLLSAHLMQVHARLEH
jgi:DNA-binding FadR family transcriptional regulator